MATNTTMSMKQLVIKGLVSCLQNNLIRMEELSEGQIDLLVETYGHNWPELLELT